MGTVLASLTRCLGTDYKTVLEDLKSGTLSDQVLSGVIWYDIAGGEGLREIFLPEKSKHNPAPVVDRRQISKSVTRERISCSNPEQMKSQAGLSEIPVDTIKSLLADGLPLGLPPELLIDN